VKNIRLSYTFYGFLAILLWSTTVALVRSLAEQMGPFLAAGTISLLGGVIGLIRLFWLGDPAARIRRLSARYLLGCGFFFVLYIFFLYAAVGLATDRLQALEIGLINYLWPVFILLFSLFLLKKKARWFLLPGTLFAVFGVFLAVTQGKSITWSSFSVNVVGNPLAYAFGLAAAISWGLYSNVTRRWGGEENDGAVPLFLLATAIVLFSLSLFHPTEVSWNWRMGVEILFMSLSTLLAYVFWDKAMRKGNVVLVAAFSYFIPLLSTLVSCVYLRVTAGLNLWIGSFFIVIGALMSWRSIIDRQSPESK